MNYLIVSKTHRGISRTVNQDSLLVIHKMVGKKEVIFAVVCDGVSGLSKGEYASQFITQEFNDWFSNNTEKDLLNIKLIGLNMSNFIKKLSNELFNKGKAMGKKMGTTFTGLLIVDRNYTCVHIGDTRLYEVDNNYIFQRTVDHVVTDKKNVLLQCVGATENITPQIISGVFTGKFFLLCSDGFRHKITEDEFVDFLIKRTVRTSKKMIEILDMMFDLNMNRNEKDNISAILIKNRRKNIRLKPVK